MDTLKLVVLFSVLTAALAGCTEETGVTESLDEELTTDTTAAADTVQAGEAFTTNLLAGQTLKIGEVSVLLDGDEILIRYLSTDPEWMILSTSLSVESNLEDIPLTNTGNPKIGLFEFSGSYNPAISDTTYKIPVAGRSSVVIAAYAEVITGDNEEGAWAEGTQFPGSSWASYFSYQIRK
jgi:hypothetical protein